MKKGIIVLLLCLSIFLVACNQEKTEENTVGNNSANGNSIEDEIMNNYEDLNEEIENTEGTVVLQREIADLKVTLDNTNKVKMTVNEKAKENFTNMNGNAVGTHEVTGIEKKVEDIYVDLLGTVKDYPAILLLMEDKTVSCIDMKNALENAKFSVKNVDSLSNIVGFDSDFITLEDGNIKVSLYAIDQDGNKIEIKSL